MKSLSAFLLLALFSLWPMIPAHSETALPSSIFFTPAETADIEKQLQKNPQNNNQATIHLGAVIYYGPDDWIVWLQGERWTPETDRPNLHIADVQPNAVRLVWIESPGTAPLTITLHPYQSYQPGSTGAGEGGK